jgi:hypothetical protein
VALAADVAAPCDVHITDGWGGEGWEPAWRDGG